MFELVKRLFRRTKGRAADPHAQVLEEQREQLRVTLASIGDAVITADDKGRVTLLNPVAEALTGWTNEDAAGRPLETVFRIVNEKTRQPVENPVAKVFGTGRIVGLANHTLLLAKDGTERGIDDSAAPIRDRAGNVTGVVLVFRDVTGQRKADRSARFRASIVESSDDAIIGKDVNGIITSWNRGAERIFGYSRAEAIGRPIAILAPADRADEMPAILARIRRGEQVEHFDTIRRAKDGRLVSISLTVSPIRDADGHIIGASKIARDITERKQSEEALREEKARLHTTLVSIGDAVIVTDAEGRVTLMNPAAQALTGWKEDAADRPLEEVFHIINEQTRQSVENPVRRVISQGMVVGLANDTLLIAKDGMERPIDDSAAPIKDAQGRVVGVVLVFRDVTGRRRAEEVLGKTAEQLRIVTDCMSVPVTRCSRDLTYQWVSQPYADWLGRPAAEIIGSPIIDIVGQQAFEQLRPHFEQVLSGQVVRYEERVHFRGIGPRWINVVYTPTRDAAGLPDGWVAVVVDVDERKRLEETIRASEQRLAAELDAMTRLHGLSGRLLACPDLRTALDDVLDHAIQTTGASFGNIQLYNPETQALEIVVQRGFQQEFLDHFRRVRVDEGSACAQAMQSGARIIIENVHLDPAYEPHRPIAAAAGYQAVQSTPLKSRSGNIVGMLSTHFRQPHRVSERDQQLLDLYARHAADFIERLRFEEALRDQAELLNLAHDAIIVRSKEGVIAYWSHGAVRMYGWSQEAAIGKVTHQLLQTEFPIPLPQIEAELEQHGWWEGTLIHTRQDGTRMTVASRWRLRGAESGRAASVLEIDDDITEQKRAEEALKEADRRKDEFLATLAHELRNPLAPIRNALELMKRGNGDAALMENVRGVMERQLAQMVRLIDDLLDISRITRGKLHLRKECVELAAAIQSAVEASRPLIDAQGHQLTVTLPQEPVCLDADPARLAQVVSNLLSNAAKYTEKGGQIWLAAERRGAEVAVSVRDTGIGIAAQHLPRLFEMFSQLEPALERSQGGLGIGLALVQGLVELHGGKVEAHSGGIGMGSEFMVRLPVEESLVAPVPEASASASARVGDTRRRRILAVDDNPDTADSLAMMLRMMGHETETAYDGLQAVQTAATFRPEIVLLDIGLPKMNGYQAARHIREQTWGKDVVLIALTGWGQEEDKRRAAEAGFDRHLTKPVEAAALEKLLAVLRPAPQG
jgi:PAS domain S-box-containing protein